MALALFNLDKTLLDCDSDYEWGEFLVNKKLVDEKEYAKANKYFYLSRGYAVNHKPLSISIMQQVIPAF